jgi:secondary thiamine-phosphate synthase enzyme
MLTGEGVMAVKTDRISLNTSREGDMIDVTGMVEDVIRKFRMKNGIVTVFVPGSTGALTTIEYEPGLLQDLPNAMEKVAPKSYPYEHEKRWHDGNGHSHVKASLIGPSLTVPFIEGSLTLGTWQQIVFIEFDVRSRSRDLIVQIIGE